MKANELRIGNLFQEKHSGKIIEVIELTQKSITYSGEFPKLWQAIGIPLTEEWLVKFGFSNGNKELSNCDLWDKHWIGEFEIQKTGTGWSFDPYRFDKVVWLQYVHQLQNLYFALTSKELEVKP